MTRLTNKTLDQLTEDQRAVYAHIIASRPVKPKNGHIGGPFDIWLRSPELGKRLVDMGGFFRFRSSVERRYIELAILVTGQHWQAQFEWWAHEPMAREAGVPEDIIRAIKIGDEPILRDAGDRACYQMARELHQNRQLSKTTFEAAVTEFSEVGVAELIALCGFYSMVSMTLNGFDVPLPSGATYPFPQQPV